MTCGVWSMFQNNKVAKITNIIEIKNNPSNDGSIVATLGILNGVYWIDSMFLVN